MWQNWQRWTREHPLLALTCIALVPRLLAAFFSEGYFAHDDHFLIIEAAGSWVQAPAYSTWLPWNQVGVPHPSGHSMVYVGLHFVLFSFLKSVAITDPKAMMLVVRMIHAGFSVVVVRVGYRIARSLGDPAIAWRTGLFLALFYFMPFLAVRNLVEVVCIPFLLLGSWYLLKEDARTTRSVLIAGIWIGLAINIRFQTIFFAAGPGLALLLMRRWVPALTYGLGLALPLAVLQGGIDLMLWGRPFAELTEYVLYNMANTTTYFDQPWYNYLLLILGIFIPPFSIAIFFGFFRRSTPLLLWLPVVLFLAIHSYFPNKQERFLFPIVPLFFVLGHVSWEMWRNASAWWAERPRLWRGIWIFTWTINIAALLLITFSSSKRSRVEALYGLRGRSDVRGLVIEDSYQGTAPMPPLFYAGVWDVPVESYIDSTVVFSDRLAIYPDGSRPNIVLFIGEEDLPARMVRMEQATGPLTILYRAEPGALDKLVHWLNPVNRNETITVAQVENERPK
jgi:hypothetical protein